METFAIYPKEGERFEIEFTRFELGEVSNLIVLYDDSRRELGFLVKSQISAVAPANPHEIERERIRIYTVRFRNHEDPIIFEAIGYPSEYPIPHEFRIDERPLTNVYIDSDEVVSLTSKLKRE
jgi:hypothetical protein